MSTSKKRQLAAILFADIVGYTALMQKDEKSARQNLEKFRNTLNEKIKLYHGQIIQYYGDGCLCTFDSAVDSVQCAKEVQQIFQSEPKVPVRIGLHSGDVFFEADNVYGDAVNIASRVESMGISGSVLVSSSIQNQIKNQTDFKLQSLGKFAFKNVEREMTVYALANEGFAVPKPENLEGKGQLIIPQKTALSKYIGLGVFFFFLLGLGYFFSAKNSLPTDIKAINSITIFPFDVKGSPDIQYLGEGIVDLVSTKLDGIPSINPIDPNRIFNELKKEQIESPTLEIATSLTKNFGASQFILGSITEVNEDLQITATKYDAAGQRIAKKSITGKQSNLAASIDELTKILVAQELTQEGQEFSSLAAMTSDNFDALTNYLKGEQAFRKADFAAAFTAFKQAIQLDSTYAMAWIRLREASGWGLEKIPDALLQAQKYKDNLPPKWQGFLKAYLLYEIGSEETEIVLKDLMQKYGEVREFTNHLGEYYFHFNPVYGRSTLEAKPWLEKTLALDPNNKEALAHLVSIAYLERNQPFLEQVIAQTDSITLPWMIAKVTLLGEKESISSSELQAITSHPYFNDIFINNFMVARADILNNYEKAKQYFPYLKNKNLRFLNLSLTNGLKGKEKAAFQLAKQENIAILTEYKQFHTIGLPATLVATFDYLPFAEQYENLYELSKKQTTPFGLFAAAKYCLLLNKTAECSTFKNQLNTLLQQEKGLFRPAAYFWHSLNAFEYFNKGQHDLALATIDSAFQYSPGHWAMQSYCMDKIFIQAAIYEEKGDYEKSIAHLENIPVVDAFAFAHGYATYRLSQLYELNNEPQKAITTCNLLMENYKDCDVQYQPWVAEVTERRNRLLKQVN